MNTLYSTGKGREANKSHWLIIGIAKLYGQTVNDAGDDNWLFTVCSL